MIYHRLIVFVTIAVLARAQKDVTGTTTPSDASTTSASSASTSSISSSTTTIASTTTTAQTTQNPLTTTTQGPAPSQKVPTWTVKSSNSTCILLTGNFTFAVTYKDVSGNTVSDKVDIPNTATASGSCAPFLNSLVLTWGQNNLTFMFIKRPIFDAGNDTGMGSYSLTSIFGRLTVATTSDGGNGNINPNSGSTSSGQTFYISARQPGFMATPLHNSYSCESYQSLAADRTGSVYLEMTGVQLEAFHDGPTGVFSAGQACTKDTLFTVLPIIGYVALAVLLGAGVGYLAWKKLSRAGYTEV